ncbi:multicopper oxidase domain-containing protein [Actinomarinicola tropica]|nr:multicopper oxidase domain-containing protein [Actinomarinicola tropica]
MTTSDRTPVHELSTDPPPTHRDGWMTITFSVAACAVFFALLAVGLALRASDEEAAAGSAGATGSQTVQVELGDLYVEPASISVPAGTEVIVEVTNAGAMPHDLAFEGDTSRGTKMLDPGETETVSLGVVETSSEAWCTVPGHKEAGMVMAIEVTGGDTEQASAAGGHDVATAAPGADGNAVIDFNAAPADGWAPYDPTLAPAPGGTEHEVTWHMTEEVIEIAPGVTQELWTFDGQVPGPTLRGKVGDIFTVTIVNDGQMGHSLDFHSSKVAWDDEMRTIAPGESLVYQFEAKHAGAYMYHCGTAPTLHHIGNGMHGAIIIDPPDLAEVDHEFVFVQHEFYTGPEGQPGDLAKMQDDEWDAVVFNGYVNQYVHAPLRVEQGERVRAWIVNNGPSENSSWHVVGTIFDTVYFEGAYSLRPDDTRGGSQALALQPAQGGFVEFTFDEEGFYPFVTHKFSNAGRGAMGLFQVGDVELPEGASH